MQVKYLGPAASVSDGSGKAIRPGQTGNFGAETIRLMRRNGHVFDGIGPEGGETPDKNGEFAAVRKIDEDLKQEPVTTAEAPGHGVLAAAPATTATPAATGGAASAAHVGSGSPTGKGAGSGT